MTPLCFSARINPPPLRFVRRLAVLAALVASLVASLVLAGPASATAYHAKSGWERYVTTRVFAQLNAERRANHLGPYTYNYQLGTSTRRHDNLMAQYDTLSHQLPNEAFFASRISAAGYRWSWAGENVAFTSAFNVDAVLDLESAMYNERPPGEVGHRENILSTHFHDVGIDIFVDRTHHRIWMAEDFGHH